MKERLVVSTLLVLGLLLAVACGDGAGGGGEGSPADGPAPGGTAVVGVAAAATTVLPPAARTGLDAEVGGLLFPGLVRGRWAEGALRFLPGDPLAVADRWRFSADGTTLTFLLAADRRWSDGTPVRPSDVVYTYRLLADTAAALPLSGVTARLDSVAEVGDTAVAFHFRRRYPGMLFDAGVGVLPRQVFGDAPPAELGRVVASVLEPGSGGGHPARPGDAGARPGGKRAGGEGRLVSGGPFVLTAWRRGERMVLVRNPRAPVQPRLDSLVVRVIPEEATRLAELRSGGLDLSPVESFRQARRLAERPGFRILSVPRRAYDYVAWNPDGHPAFGDVRVRRALSLAVDRRVILDALETGPYAEPARGPYGPLFPELSSSLPRPVHDPEEAGRLLHEAGWVLPAGAQVRRKEGRELAFELAVPAGDDRRGPAAELIAAQLAEIGVLAEIRIQEFTSLFGRVRAGDYEAALLGWQVGLDPDISPFFGDPSAPLNVVGHDDAAARSAMDSALAAPTAAAARPHWRRAAEAVVEDQPYAFLWYFDRLFVAGPRLRDVEIGVTGWSPGAHRWRIRPPPAP